MLNITLELKLCSENLRFGGKEGVQIVSKCRNKVIKVMFYRHVKNKCTMLELKVLWPTWGSTIFSFSSFI